MKTKTVTVELPDDFFDREEYKYALKKHLQKLNVAPDGHEVLMIFSGVKGIGKSSLLKWFVDEAIGKKSPATKFIRHNFGGAVFSDKIDMFGVLKKLRASLTKKYQVEFPLFDKASIYFAQKIGEFVGAEQIQFVMKSNAMIRGFKSFLNSNAKKIDDSAAVLKFVDLLVDESVGVLSDLSKTSTVLRAGKLFVNLIDDMIVNREENARAKGDTEYGELADKLNELNQGDDAEAVGKLLPKLFAKDLSYWLKSHDTNLIVIFDAYEKLTGNGVVGDEPADWWVAELLAAERVMWIIASTFAIEKIGGVEFEDDQIEKYTVGVFDKNWSEKYLQFVGVEQEELRTAIIELAGGHPYYLRKCAETYKIFRLNGKVPRPEDFGKNRDEIIDRLLGTLDENGQFMTQCLCILKQWTDEVAAAVIQNFNNFTYRHVKKMFAREDSSSLADETIYTFDEDIDAILFPNLKADVTCRKLFADIRDGANVYFKKFFDEHEQLFYRSGKPEFYFGVWSDIILRTTDKPVELMTIYCENIEPIEYRFYYSTLENIVGKFFDTVGDNETLPSAYFQSRLADVKHWPDKIKDALELATAAYDKVQKLSLRDDERPIKISVMRTLADVFNSLARYTDEISLLKKIVAECESYYPDKRDDRTIAAKRSLAWRLKCVGRQNDAIKIYRQIFELFDERYGEKFIEAAYDLAGTLEENNDYESALTVYKKVLAFAENQHDDEKIKQALARIISALENFSDEEHLEERLAYYRQYFALCEKIGRKVDTYYIKHFAETLKALGRNDEAEQAYKKFIDDLKRRIEAVDNPNLETLDLMCELGLALYEVGQETEAVHWREKITIAIQTIIEQTCREPIEDYDAAISTLKALYRYRFYGEWNQFKLEREILALTEKKPAAEESAIIEAKENLLQSLLCNEEYREEAEQLFEDVENYYRQKLPTSREDFLNTLRKHAGILQDHSVAVEKLTEALDLLENDSEPDTYEMILIMQDIAREFDCAENYSEELIWRERILNFYREHFAEGAPEILDALVCLIFVCKDLEDCDKAELYGRELVDITERNCGAAHVNTIEAKQKLADILHDAEKYGDELNLREQIVDLWRENFSVSPANKENYFSDFIDAGINFASLILETADELDATAERLKALDRLKSLLEETIDGYGEGSDEATKILDCLDDIRFLIGYDAQALAKFDELFGAYTTEIDASESLNLLKGQRVPLAKDDSVPEKLTVDFRWESDTALEIDASAFLLGTDGKAHADEDFIFYGNEESGGVKYLDGNGRATMQVELKKISDAVAKISFALSIYDAGEKTFSGVKIFARIVDEMSRKEILHFDLTDEFTSETIVVIGEIYRHKGEWKFNAVGAGFNGGLDMLCEKFGLEVN